jgi:hypothetical protein
MLRFFRAGRLSAPALALIASLALVSCGKSPGSPSPQPTPTPTPTPPPSGGTGTTITITAAGVSPRDLTVARGVRVTFVNSDTVPHDMSSDPHPAHTDCPALNVGFLSAGQSRDTDLLNTARNCGFHDHNQPSNPALQGTIRIQ